MHQIAYYPNSSVCLKKIAKLAEENLQSNNNQFITPKFYIRGYNNMSEIYNLAILNDIFGTIQFNESFVNATICPKDISLRLRFTNSMKARLQYAYHINSWRTDQIIPHLKSERYSELYRASKSDIMQYYRLEGMIALNHAFAMAFIKYFNQDQNFNIPNIRIDKLPIIPMYSDPLLRITEEHLPFIIAMSLLIPCLQTVKHVAREKEKHLRSIMRMIGVPDYLHSISWFVRCYSVMIIISTLIVIFLKYNWIGDQKFSTLGFTDIKVLLLLLYTYCISLVTLGIMLVAFTSKPSIAVCLLIMTELISSLSYKVTATNFEKLSLCTKLLFCLFPNSAMGYGFLIIIKLEDDRIGLHLADIFQTDNTEYKISFFYIIMVLLCTSLMFFLIALYVEKLNPGPYGISEYWYFPFSRQYWFPPEMITDFTNIEANIRAGSNFILGSHEMISKAKKKVGVAIINLKKSFDDKVAVNDLSMILYKDEISVLLGKNGVGKTTIMLMLAGLIYPTSGTAILNGYDIEKNREKATGALLGFCPKKDILFEELTIRQHIILFGRLKGLSKCAAEYEVKKYTELLQFEDKIDTMLSELSHGTIRKLSVALAFCGKSQVVLCDQPTSGMDPLTRRLFWNLLQTEKKGRTIFIATHFVDQANIIGDQIGFMSNGELKAWGTPLSLKEKYGSGYELTILKNEDCDASKVTNFLSGYIRNITMKSNNKSMLKYKIAEKGSEFKNVLIELEKKFGELKIEGCRITNTTLDEILMSVYSSADDSRKNEKMAEYSKDINITNMEQLKNDNYHIYDKNDFMTGNQLRLSQCKAVFLKNYYFVKRDYVFRLQIFLSIFFVSVCVVTTNLREPFADLKDLKYNITHYDKTIIVVQSLNSSDKNFQEIFFKTFKNYIYSLHKNHLFIETPVPIPTYVISLGERIGYLNSKNVFIFGVHYENSITIYYDQYYYHAAGDVTNTIYNVLLRIVTKDESARFDVSNCPFPYVQQVDYYNFIEEMHDMLVHRLTLCMGLVSALNIAIQIKQRVRGVKFLEFRSGVHVVTFWLSQFFCDFARFFVISVTAIIMLSCFQIEGFQTIGGAAKTLLIFMVLGVETIPKMYVFAFSSSDYTSGLISSVIYNIYEGIAPFYFIRFAEDIIHGRLFHIGKALVSFFCPLYTFANGLEVTLMTSRTLSQCFRYCEDDAISECNMDELCKFKPEECCVPDYFAFDELPSMGSKIFSTMALLVFNFSLLAVKEFKIIDLKLFEIKNALYLHYFSNIKDLSCQAKDSGVQEEECKVANMKDMEEMNLVADELTQTFFWKALAVNEISLAVPPSECLGLLGNCGAGKTVFYEMVTGRSYMSSGEIYVKGYSIKTDIREVLLQTGYCPQQTAFLGDLTAREIFKIFALLRGIQRHKINEICENLSKIIGLEQFMDKPIQLSSGGNERKLSTLIAFLGNASIFLLDNATSGIDYVGRQFIINKTGTVLDAGKSLIISCNYTEDCEIMCTRIAFMVHGELKYLGSIRKILKKFSKDIILKIVFTKELELNEEEEKYMKDIQKIGKFSKKQKRIIQLIKKHFNNAEVSEHYERFLKFHIPQASDKWLKLFEIIEKNKESLNIEDCSINQPTLEDIFLTFMKTIKCEEIIEKLASQQK